MSRWCAAAIHLCLSLAIFGLFLLLTFLVWYPPPYFSAMQTWGLLGLLGGVDVVLGPCLTLLVFKTGKKSLKFDLSVIVLLQVMALAYGALTVAQARPAFVVFSAESYSVVIANEAKITPEAAPSFQQPSLWGPTYAFYDYMVLLSELRKGANSFASMAKHYQPLSAHKDKVLAAAKPLSRFESLAVDANPQFKAYFAAHKNETGKALQISLYNKNGIALIDEQTALPKAIVLLGK